MKLKLWHEKFGEANQYRNFSIRSNNKCTVPIITVLNRLGPSVYMYKGAFLN